MIEKHCFACLQLLKTCLNMEVLQMPDPSTQNKEQVICCACIMGTWCIHDAHKQCKIHKTPPGFGAAHNTPGYT